MDNVGGGFVLGFLACAVIVGFWTIGTGILSAVQMKKRRTLSVVAPLTSNEPD